MRNFEENWSCFILIIMSHCYTTTSKIDWCPNWIFALLAGRKNLETVSSNNVGVAFLHRVLSIFSSRRNWDFPNPSPAGYAIPNFQVPSRRKLTRDIAQLGEEAKNILSDLLSKVNFVATTADSWSAQNRSFPFFHAVIVRSGSIRNCGIAHSALVNLENLRNCWLAPPGLHWLHLAYTSSTWLSLAQLGVYWFHLPGLPLVYICSTWLILAPPCLYWLIKPVHCTGSTCQILTAY